MMILQGKVVGILNVTMALTKTPALQFKTCCPFGAYPKPFSFLPNQRRSFFLKPLVVEARVSGRKESAKIRNRRNQKKFNGTPTKPRLSVFCSEKQLYAMLVDDQNKKCLFYGSTLQKSVRGNPPCTTVVSISSSNRFLACGGKTKKEAAERVGEELIKTCIDLNINEISSYDRNGCSRGEKMQAFEIPISRHGFLAQ